MVEYVSTLMSASGDDVIDDEGKPVLIERIFATVVDGVRRLPMQCYQIKMSVRFNRLLLFSRHIHVIIIDSIGQAQVV